MRESIYDFFCRYTESPLKRSEILSLRPGLLCIFPVRKCPKNHCQLLLDLRGTPPQVTRNVSESSVSKGPVLPHLSYRLAVLNDLR